MNITWKLNDRMSTNSTSFYDMYIDGEYVHAWVNKTPFMGYTRHNFFASSAHSFDAGGASYSGPYRRTLDEAKADGYAWAAGVMLEHMDKLRPMRVNQ